MFIPVKDLKKGMVVYECSYGRNIKMIIKEDAINTGEGYQATGVSENGIEVNLYAAHTYEHYGPRLYDELKVFK
jgi:hypothetical protein